MPVIIPPSRDRLGESVVEAEAAGATADTMRIVRLRGGVVGLEVTQEVYDTWAGKHPDEAGEQPAPDDAAPADTADDNTAADDETGDDTPEPDDDEPDGDATSSGTTRTRKRASGTTRRH
jgi:hypothetical protein